MVSLDLGSDVSNDLSTIFNTWKLPDISSLHNVIRTGINLIEAMQTFISPRISFRQFNTNRIGGAERDRTADPLLAKQVLSQLSYSPNRFDHLLQAIPSSPKTKMVGPGRLELPTSRLSGVRSNHLSYGPILGKARTPNALQKRQAGVVRILVRKRNVDGGTRHTVMMQASMRRIAFDGHLTGAIYVLKSTGKVMHPKMPSSNSTASLERR